MSFIVSLEIRNIQLTQKPNFRFGYQQNEKDKEVIDISDTDDTFDIKKKVVEDKGIIDIIDSDDDSEDESTKPEKTSDSNMYARWPPSNIVTWRELIMPCMVLIY